MIKAFKFLLPALLVATAIFFACNKSDEITVDEAVDSALFSIQERGGMGRFGCFELVFPVTLSLSGGATAEVDSYEAMKQTLRAYFETNGCNRPAPAFVFPIAVLSQEGELISVNNQDELSALRAGCRARFADHDPRGHSRRWLSCFEIVFPVTVEFPDGTIAQARDRRELQQLIRVWNHDNPDVRERPVVVFPVTAKMTEDGTLVTVNNREELHNLKERCE